MVESYDSYECPTTGPTDALAGINDFAEGLIGYQGRSQNVLKSADAHADSALANIYAACLWMFLERPEAVHKAKPYIERAAACQHMNHRERGLLEFVTAWNGYEHHRATDIAEQLLQSYPQDLVSLKFAHYHAFNAGDANRMLNLARLVQQANESRAPWHSMLAFGYEQSNRIDEAERAANCALEIDINEPWAHHALAHVHLSRGSIREGHAFLLEHKDSWSGLNSFMFTHNWWHMALFEIADGRADQALSIYDERCWGIEPDYSQDQIGAVSLLARLECAGIDVGDRWITLLPYLESRNDDVIQPFLTLQYLYGLARASSSLASELLQLVEAQADKATVAEDTVLWNEVGVSAAHGVYAHATGEYKKAADYLLSVRSRLWRIGGSHAQRDLFEQLLLDALIKSGQWQAVLPKLERRLQWEPDNPARHRQLAKARQMAN